jgi:hypothetical protein
MTPLLLSDPLPLRRASDLPAWREDDVLPWVYGRVTLSPVPLDDAGLTWLIADHPIVAATQVSFAGVATDGWQLVQKIDETGHAVALLRLTQPPKSGEVVAVTVTGRQHAVTGAVIEHPADIAADVLRQCGWGVTPDAFQGVRDAYPGLTVGLVINDARSLNATLGEIITPLGAVWDAARLLAIPRTPGLPVAVLDVRTAEDISATTEGELGTVARVTFNHDWASGQAHNALTLDAPESIDRYGRIPIDIALPTVRRGRDALMIATTRLQNMARPQWQISAKVAGAGINIAPGDTVQLAHPRIPQGSALVLSVAREYRRDTLTLTAWMPAGDPPRVILTGQGGAVDPARAAANAFTYRDGVATFTVTDDAGTPLVGAAVQLDGQELRNTDRAGQVQFRTTRGPHTLSVYQDSYAPFEIDVIV